MSEYQEVGGGETVTKNKKLITITANAVERVRYLLDKKKHTNLEEAIGIRVLIKQKGCSGLKYDIEYAYDIRPLESIIEENCSDGQKVKVLIDPKSVMFILGSEMDYVEEKFSSGFVFKNPNEKGKCGCGESFHV
ncbi:MULTISPECIES: HesB/IscA family protein [unclassified Wolbachia]|uniref:Iron-sulfur cluster assembly accessory protein n=1 Tax=Wolbachia endosymbiont of Sergentomyia squamirostris TaxID=3113640 RepID=A0AAT9GE61_9RICK|nr:MULTISPECIES: iron-sulfur cluster assembly accessory protein [unclassified Wolbachia]MCX3065491.1 iron-sulfur cluster assembly accessory protein [Wolbachia endosymbiont of Drosophila pseudotakahashii]UZE38848.1 iron-sulfur cluster assembly accessory protein [Wolbachia endosymbiont of Drosophila pseudotakahashii]